MYTSGFLVTERELSSIFLFILAVIPFFFFRLNYIRILSSPKARPILLNGAVRKGEHIVPPSALDLLMRASFPAPSARVKVCLF